MSYHVQYQDLEIEAAKWNSANIHFIIYACAFPTVTCQNAFCVKGLSLDSQLSLPAQLTWVYTNFTTGHPLLSTNQK